MNAKQRNRNRKTAKDLHRVVRKIQLQEHVCENCGQTGGHWVAIRGRSVEAILQGVDDSQGFWNCPMQVATIREHA